MRNVRTPRVFRPRDTLFLCVLAAVTTAAGVACAEKVYFKDGSVRDEKILNITKEQIYFKAPGGYRTVRMATILRIDNDDGSVSQYDYHRAVEKCRVLMEAHQYPEALALCNQLVGLFPDYVPLRYARAALWHRTGDTAHALEEYRYLAEHGGADDTVYNNMGVIYAARHLSVDAAAAFAKALEKNPSSIDIMMNYGTALLEGGSYARAADTLRMIVQKDASRTVARYNLGVAYFNLGDKDAARRAWEEVLARVPDDREARAALAYLKGTGAGTPPQPAVAPGK